MLKPLDVDMGFIPDNVFHYLEGKYQLTIDEVYPYAGINGIPISLNKRSETSRKIIIQSNEKLYILKEIPWYVNNLIKLDNILKLQQEINKRHEIVPSILKNDKGDLFTNCFGKNYFIQEYLDGYAWKYHKLQSFEAGRMLKEFHSATKSFDSKDGIKEQSIISNAMGLLNLLMRQYKKTRKSIPKQDGKNFLTLINIANKNLRGLNIILDKFNYGKIKQIVHGDYNPNNMTFNSNHTVKGVYDLDNMAYDDPLHDIAEGLVDFSMVNYKTLSSRFESLELVPNQSRFEAFIRGYSIDTKDLRVNSLLPSCIGVIIIEFICLGLLRNDWSINQALVYLHGLKSVIDTSKELLEGVELA